MPAAGNGLLVALSAGAVLVQDRPVAAFLVLLLPAAALLAFALFADRIILDLPWSRRRGNNLLACRTPATPRLLIVAHRDTKSQGVPLAARVGGVITCIIAWLLLVIDAMTAGAMLPAAPLIITAGAGVAGSIALIACGVGNASPGALDNASGLAALVRIARQVRDPRVAFLVTDAEELGLAGSRAVAARFGGLDAVINMDGLDDDGPIVLIEGRWPWRPSKPGEMAGAILDCAREQGVATRRRGLLPGLLVDHVAFARAGVPSLTVLKGTLRSLIRVHSSADDRASLRGDGAAEVAAIIAATLERRLHGAPGAGTGEG